MTTQLEMYNLALANIRETILADVSEAREARYQLDLYYDTDLQWMLEAGFWKFAMRTVKIDYDPDTSTAFGAQRVFNKPADWIRTYIVSAAEALDPPLDAIEGSHKWYVTMVTKISAILTEGLINGDL